MPGRDPNPCRKGKGGQTTVSTPVTGRMPRKIFRAAPAVWGFIFQFATTSFDMPPFYHKQDRRTALCDEECERRGLETRPSLAQALVYPLFHQVAIQSEFHAGVFLELQDAVGISLGPGSGLDAQIELTGGLAVYQDLRVSVHIVDVHEVVLVEHGVELLLQKFRVLGSHPEHDLRTDVAENRIPYIFLQLGDELMGDGQGQPVFARFGQDARNARGSEILELVDIQVEIPALRFLRDVHPGKRGHQDLAGEDHAQEPRVDVPYPALGEIHQEYLAVVHHSPEIERGPGLADDGPHIVVRHEIIELGSDVRRHVREGRLAARLDRLLLPEVDDHRVLDARQLPLAVFRIGENARHLHQGGRLVRHVLHQKQKGVPLVLFEHGTHGLRHEQLVEDSLHLVHDEGLLLRTVEVVIQHVQAHRPPNVAGVEINEVLHALLGDMPQDEVNQSAVGIDDRETLAGLDVLDDHVTQEGRFAGAGLADQINVAAAILVRDENGAGLSAKNAPADERALGGKI